MSESEPSARPWAQSREGTAETGTEPATVEPAPPDEAAPKPSKAETKPKAKDYTADVVRSLLEGEKESSVAAWLKRKGLDPEPIEDVISRAQAQISQERDERAQEDIDAAEHELREQKRKHLVYGGAWFAGGLILTIATYSAATEAGGGRYILAWGR